MPIVTICGSTGKQSSNSRLLDGISHHFSQWQFEKATTITQLPLYIEGNDHFPYCKQVEEWRNIIKRADSIIISTPAYLENIPAVLKNGFEWLTTSGELAGKATLALTFTPHPPRGKNAMQSLLWTLEALNARIVAQCPLYQTELQINEMNQLEGSESISMLEAALEMLTS